MNTDDLISLMRKAGMPADLPMVQVDEWLAQTTAYSPRQARQWRISGRVPAIVVKLLGLMARAEKAGN